MPSLSKAIGKLRRREGGKSPTRWIDASAVRPPTSTSPVAAASIAPAPLFQVSHDHGISSSIRWSPSSSTSEPTVESTMRTRDLPSSVQPTEVADALLATTNAPSPPEALESGVQNKAIEKAFDELAGDVEPEERDAFLRAYENITLEQTFATIRSLDERDSSSYGRRSARSLAPAIRILEQFLTGVAIGIQQSPEISSLVVGGVRLVIDLVAKFVDFYNKLSEMICDIGDFLKPLATYSLKASDKSDLQHALIGIYVDLLRFFQQARLVFVTQDGSIRKFGTFRMFFRVQWQPFEDKFGVIKSRFFHHLRVLENSAYAQQLSILNNLNEIIGTEFSQARLERTRAQSQDERNERLKFLEWISSANHEADFDRIIKQRHPGTGLWLLENAKFQKWEQESSSSLLWCYGNPGAGKSVLASIALDHLTKNEFNEERTCVIFAYYNYRNPERDDPTSLLGALIKQLCAKIGALPENIQNFYQNTINNAKTPTFEDMEPLFYGLLESYSKVFIIIDALDECQAPSQDNDKLVHLPGYRPRHREEVLEFIVQLTSRQWIYAKVLVTSRRERDIQSTFYHRPVIEIDTNKVNADIRTFLQDEIERRTLKRSLRLQDSRLKEEILQVLGARAQGMFLWAKLQLDWICEQDGDEDIREALSDLPRDLHETYDHILKRINQQTPRLQEVGRKALMWVLCTESALTMRDLQEALAIEPSIKSLKGLQSKIRDPEVILSSAGNLIMVETRYPYYVRPIHASVKEYLTKPCKEQSETAIAKYFIDTDLANCQLAMSSLSYLQLDIFARGPCENFTEFWGRYLSDPSARLRSYACFFFDKHIQRLQVLEPEVERQLDLLLRSDENVLAAILQGRRTEALSTNLTRSEFLKYRFPANAATLIYSTTLYGVLRSFRPDSEWLRVAPPNYALHHAVTEGLDGAVARFVQLSLDINEKDEDGKTPLYYASTGKNSFKITECLLEHGAEVNLESGELGPALLPASGNGNLPVVETLLQHKADTNLQGGEYGTALQHASAMGHLKVVEKLLEYDADANLQGGYFGSALQAACYHGYPPVVKALLDHRANVNQQGGTYCTALFTASYFGYTTVVELLVVHSADVNLRCGEHGTALEAAARNGHTAIVELLLKHGATGLSTSLIAACQRQNQPWWGNKTHETAVLLLEKGAEFTTKILESAAGNGWFKLCQMLLERGAEITTKAYQNICTGKWKEILQLFLDKDGEGPAEALEAATESRWYEGCMMLLERGVEITPQAHVNACSPRFQNDPNHVAQIILENGRTVRADALEQASKWGWYQRCQTLLDRGVEITPQAIVNACGFNCRSDYVVWLLLRRGAQVTDEILMSVRELGLVVDSRRYRLLLQYQARQRAQVAAASVLLENIQSP